MIALLVTVFVASLLGSLHCVGMCGPFALLAGTGDGRSFRAAPTMAYSAGRLISYVAVGI
ncbi:MAG: sulfite exporter TauE/SafE family protein, partial [Planctomycetaceae bacterium]|nr:sulfite exporter TauE/SafE family protein [Planctomycetaceae bacterium]